MKMYELNVRGSLRTLGRILGIEDFQAFIGLVVVLKSNEKDDSEVTRNFTYPENEGYDRVSFDENLRYLIIRGYCDKKGENCFSFTDSGWDILEKWSESYNEGF